MSTPSDVVPSVVSIEAVRRVAAARAAATSVNRVAKQVGMTARGLQLFLDGSAPYTPTRQKLTQWYVREVARGTSEIDVHTARAALQVLMHELPPNSRDRVHEQAVAWWIQVYEEQGIPPPGWLKEIGGQET